MLEDEGYGRTVSQAMELWINPEIDKRQKSGTLSKPAALYLAQVIFKPSKEIFVRLNDEVQMHGKIKLKTTKAQDEPIMLSDIDEIISLNLVEEEQDYGHITRTMDI